MVGVYKQVAGYELALLYAQLGRHQEGGWLADAGLALRSRTFGCQSSASHGSR